ncbi:unnamed protein product [Arabidopsis halleri]
MLAQQQQHESIRTMEDFSGCPIHELGQFCSINLASSLSVDAPGLQKQIDELSNFSDAPSPSLHLRSISAALTSFLHSHSFFSPVISLAKSKGFDFGSNDILCSYDVYTNQDSSNRLNSDLAIAATNSKKVLFMQLRDRLIYEAVDEVNSFPQFYGPDKTFVPLPLDSVVKAEKLTFINGNFTSSLLT